jgi:hypothetical protein
MDMFEREAELRLSNGWFIYDKFLLCLFLFRLLFDKY